MLQSKCSLPLSYRSSISFLRKPFGHLCWSSDKGCKLSWNCSRSPLTPRSDASSIPGSVLLPLRILLPLFECRDFSPLDHRSDLSLGLLYSCSVGWLTFHSKCLSRGVSHFLQEMPLFMHWLARVEHGFCAGFLFSLFPPIPPLQ